MNQIDLDAELPAGAAAFHRHPRFPDMFMLHARFTQQRYDLHTHFTYVIALITAGCEQLRIGGRQHVAPAGQVIVVHPEECHDGESATTSGWAYRTLYPSIPLMTEVARELGRDGPPVFARPVIDDPALGRSLFAAHRAAAEGDCDVAEEAMLLALRSLIMRHAGRSRSREPTDHGGARRRCASYAAAIDAGLRDALDLQRLADLAGVTRFQVIRDFKRVTGLTPGSYVRNRRLRAAWAMLQQGAAIADAAAAAGFSDQSHLTRCFRHTHGITPAALRHALLR